MSLKPLVLDIKGNSLDDGPGIRSVIFFKGCPLACVWCHNPESKKAGAEISYDPKECLGCKTCLGVCAENAISPHNPFYVAREQCNLCFQCVEICPAEALTRVGNETSIEEICKKVLRDKPFYKSSGGGVSLSGGEATLHMDFVSRLVQKLKQEGIHILLETCGLFNFAKFEKQILPYIDTIYYDLKLFNSEEHAKFCGVPNQLILENFEKLAKLLPNGHFELLPRTPLIPQITDNDENLKAIALFLIKNNLFKIQLMPNNPLWHEKNNKIGTAALESHPVLSQWMDADKIKHCESIFKDQNIGL
ncbi:glycyl-radical enzyme activating protein [Deltaproteobacteria bacterium TL4]